MTTPELYDPALDCWRELTPTPVVKMQTYPFMFLLPDGQIFQAGRSKIGVPTDPDYVGDSITRRLALSIPEGACTVNGSATWTTVSLSNIDGASGSAVLYRALEHVRGLDRTGGVDDRPEEPRFREPPPHLFGDEAAGGNEELVVEVGLEGHVAGLVDELAAGVGGRDTQRANRQDAVERRRRRRSRAGGRKREVALLRIALLERQAAGESAGDENETAQTRPSTRHRVHRPLPGLLLSGGLPNST